MRAESQGIIVDAEWSSAGDPGGEWLDRGQGAAAGDVEVEVEAAVVQKDEVLYCVDALDRVAIAVVGGEEPFVVLLEQVAACACVPDVDLEVWILFLTDVRRV